MRERWWDSSRLTLTWGAVWFHWQILDPLGDDGDRSCLHALLNRNINEHVLPISNDHVSDLPSQCGVSASPFQLTAAPGTMPEIDEGRPCDNDQPS
ncbi:MAG: hypothetical protein CMJ80_06890 [Planctomycetaceae bacterium]|nr:hypothetical protein [Planctomycetaceae bacterium]